MSIKLKNGEWFDNEEQLKDAINKKLCKACKYLTKSYNKCIGCHVGNKELFIESKIKVNDNKNKNSNKGEKKMHKYYELAKACFSIVVNIRNLNNETEVDLNETFDTISEERQKLLYDNIEHILKNPNITAKQEHDVWVKLKEETGWVYGEKTDRKRKIHSCIVPFEDLNFYQKLKDHLVIETIKMYFGL
jgi:hypothetical protein